MEDCERAVGGELEDDAEVRAEIRGTSTRGRAVEVAAAVEDEPAVGIGAVVVREAVEEGVRAIGSDLEDDAESQRVSPGGRAVEIPARVEDDAAPGIGAVVPGAEIVEGRQRAVGGELEHGAVIRPPAPERRAVEVAGAIEGDPGGGIGSVAPGEAV